MTNIIAQLVEMELHKLEKAETEFLLTVVRTVHDFLTQKSLKKDTPLMARTTVTDDQAITTTFALTDADKVAVEGNPAPVVVTTVDDAGADLSKWIGVAQDAANPLKFVTTRKSNDDGTQPQEIPFSLIGTLQVNGQTKTHQDDYLYTPGVPENLSSTVVIAAAPSTGGASGSSTTSGQGSSGAAPVEQPPGVQEQTP